MNARGRHEAKQSIWDQRRGDGCAEVTNLRRLLADVEAIEKTLRALLDRKIVTNPCGILNDAIRLGRHHAEKLVEIPNADSASLITSAMLAFDLTCIAQSMA
jgi:hypothetical protein